MTIIGKTMLLDSFDIKRGVGVSLDQLISLDKFSDALSGKFPEMDTIVFLANNGEMKLIKDRKCDFLAV